MSSEVSEEGDFLSQVGKAIQDSDMRDAVWRLTQQLREAKDRTKDLVAATIQASRDATLALGPVSPVPMPVFPTLSDTYHEAALWDTGDWQFSKTTPTYDSAVAASRVRAFVLEAQKITAYRRATVNINEGVVVFGGDMIEGLFNFPGQAFEVDATLFEQFVKVSRLIVEVVQAALATFAVVHVVAEWGNHGRVGSKRDNVPRGDNFDRMCYHLAKELLSHEIAAGRLLWPESEEDVQRLEVGNYRALVIHGDEVGRGGFASPSTLIRHADRWKSGAYRYHGEPWDFRDVYVHHFHVHAEYPMANGEGAVYQTGSTESDNRYARDGMAAAAIPSQRLHFIDPEKGIVTAQHKIALS